MPCFEHPGSNTHHKERAMTELHEQAAQSPLPGSRDRPTVLGERGTVPKAIGRPDDAALDRPAGTHRQDMGSTRGTQRLRGRHWGAALVVVAVSLATFVAIRARTDPAPRPVVENVATRWVERALAAVRSGNPGVHTGTPGAARTYAMTTAAMYDAVNGIDRAG